MQTARDIFQLIAEHISDFETWYHFSQICKSAYGVTKRMWSQKKLDFAEVRIFNIQEANCHQCGLVPSIIQINYYVPPGTDRVKITGVGGLFYEITQHNGTIIDQKENSDGKLYERSCFNHDGTLSAQTKFIEHISLYETTYYHPDGKTIQYQGKHQGGILFDLYKTQCWNKYTENGKLVATEFWLNGELDHVVFQDNLTSGPDKISCMAALDSSSCSLEIEESYSSDSDSGDATTAETNTLRPPLPHQLGRIPEIDHDPLLDELYDQLPLQFGGDEEGGAEFNTLFEYQSDPDSSDWESISSSIESIEILE